MSRTSIEAAAAVIAAYWNMPVEHADLEIAQALAEAGLLVTVEARDVLEAADEWCRGNRCDPNSALDRRLALAVTVLTAMIRRGTVPADPPREAS